MGLRWQRWSAAAFVAFYGTTFTVAAIRSTQIPDREGSAGYTSAGQVAGLAGCHRWYEDRPEDVWPGAQSSGTCTPLGRTDATYTVAFGQHGLAPPCAGAVVGPDWWVVSDVGGLERLQLRLGGVEISGPDPDRGPLECP